MELTIYYGNTGTGKSYAVMERIKENAQKGERSLVIVPGQFTFEYEKKLYKYLGLSLYNSGYVDVLSLDRVKNKIFEVVPPEKRGSRQYCQACCAMACYKYCQRKRGLCLLQEAGRQTGLCKHLHGYADRAFTFGSG